MSSDVEPTMQGYFRLGAALWGGIPDDTCMNARPNDYWRCYMGEYSIQYIETPLLVHQESEDFVQLIIDGDDYPINETNKQEYLNYFRVNITTALSRVVSPHSVYSPACYWHCSTETDQFWNITFSNGLLSDQEALHLFFWNGNVANWIDDCDGFSCSDNCPVVII